MLQSSASSTQWKRSYYNLFILLASAVLSMVVCAPAARAQMGGIDPDPGDPGNGGRNTIQGSIFFANGRRLDHRAKVTLRRNSGGEQFTFSDDTGAFSFRRLQSGTYTVNVDAGPEFAITTDTVDIIEPAARRNSMGSTHTVNITLQPKPQAPASPAGTVDAVAAGAPDAARDLYKQAITSAQSGDRKKAIEQLNQALAISPDFVAALNELGVQYLNLHQIKQAAEALQKALKLAPDSFYPRLNYGIALLQMKDARNAAIELERAVRKDGLSALAHLHLGHALVSLGNYEYAESELKQAVTIGGDQTVEAHRFLGAVYIEKHDSARAATELEAYLKLAPKAPDADRLRDILKQLRAQATSKP